MKIDLPEWVGVSMYRLAIVQVIGANNFYSQGN